MKNTILILCILLTGATTFCQNRRTNSPASITFNPNSGYVNTTEFQPGIGLAYTDVPYGKNFFGITNISGYQISFKNNLVDKKLQAGIGTGVFIYNEGTLMPLFLDFRFIWNERTVTPFIFASGGGLIHFNDFNKQSRMFINPGAGARYTISESMAVHLGAGLFVQSGAGRRDSYLNFKLGLSFKPNR